MLLNGILQGKPRLILCLNYKSNHKNRNRKRNSNKNTNKSDQNKFDNGKINYQFNYFKEITPLLGSIVSMYRDTPDLSKWQLWMSLNLFTHNGMYCNLTSNNSNNNNHQNQNQNKISLDQVSGGTTSEL